MILLIIIGDVFSQKVIEKQPYDYIRTIRFAGIGGCFIVPTTRTWFDLILPRIVPIESNKTSLAIKRVLVDGFIGYVPIISTLYVTLNMIASNEIPLDKVKEKVKNEQLEIMAYGWLFWAPANFINFRFLPSHLHVPYIQLAALFWNTFLSYKSHDNLHN